MIFFNLPTVLVDSCTHSRVWYPLMKQPYLFKEFSRQAEFGGSLLSGKRKSRRHFSKKRPMHITFRTNGDYTLFPKRNKIQNLVIVLAKKHGVRVYERSINSNHLHLLLRTAVKISLQNFLRELSIKIVCLVTGTRKGKRLTRRFWKFRPWSRIVEWGRAFQTVKKYIFRNRLETEGRIPYDRTIKTEKILEDFEFDFST